MECTIIHKRGRNHFRIEQILWNISDIETVLVCVWQDYNATDFIPCLRRPTDPQLVDVLTLRGQETKLNGILVVTINNTPIDKESAVKISFSLAAAGDTPSVSIAGLVS
jgi:hypothetical protein